MVYVMQKSTQTALGVSVVLVPAIGYLVCGLGERLLMGFSFTESGWAEWLVIGFVGMGGIWFIFAAVQGMQEMEEVPKMVTHNGEQMLQCVGMNPLALRYSRKATFYLGEEHLVCTPSWREKAIPWNLIQQVTGVNVPTFHFADGKTLTFVISDAQFITVIRTLEKHNVNVEQQLLSHASRLEKEQKTQQG